MKGKRYTEEFKREAIKQVTERGYSVAAVAQQRVQHYNTQFVRMDQEVR